METITFRILHYISLIVSLLGVVFIIRGIIKISARSVLIELSKHTEGKTTKGREDLRRQFSSYFLPGSEPCDCRRYN